MGFFLVGAYQEILGDMHNLFGDTHSAIVNMDEQGIASITEINLGDTVADMMRYVHLDVEGFQQSYAQLVSAKIAADEQQSVLDELQSGLDGYTYLEEL
jgi:arginine decarboxylase